MASCLKLLFFSCKHPALEEEDDAVHGIRVHPEQAENLGLSSDKEGTNPLSTCGLSNRETTDINERSSFQSERVLHQGNNIDDAFNGVTGQEEDACYQTRKGTEDSKSVANESEPVNTMPNETSRISEENRLSEQEMNQRVDLELSAEETNLENVTSKSRPSLTAAKYVELHSNEWLEAKEALDAHHTEEEPWSAELLCRTIQIGVDTATEVLETLLKTISTRGTCSYPSAHDGEDSLAETVESLPPSLSHEIHQCIKSNSLKFDASDIAERICMQLTSEFPDNFPEVKEEKAVQLFIKACAEVAWQIVIQQPPMYLSCSPTKFDEECHERCWDDSGSFDMAPNQIDLEYIWPILYESERKNRVLKKGIVRMIPRPTYFKETQL